MMVMIISEKDYKWICVFFSTMVDLFKNRNSISPFKTVITDVPLVLASTL